MTHTLNTVIYDIAEQVGQATNDIFLARMKQKVLINRAVVLRQDHARNGVVDIQAMQSIGDCVDMVKSSMVECCGIDLGCQVVRSREKLPSFVRFKGAGPISFVGTVDRSLSYGYIEPSRIQSPSSKFLLHLPKYTLINGYLYLINTTPMKIRVEGVLEDPFESNKYGCSEGECFTSDSKFPLSGDLIKLVQQMMYEELRNPKLIEDDREVETQKER